HAPALASINIDDFSFARDPSIERSQAAAAHSRNDSRRFQNRTEIQQHRLTDDDRTLHIARYFHRRAELARPGDGRQGDRLERKHDVADLNRIATTSGHTCE